MTLAEALLGEAITEAERLAKVPARTFASVKRQMRIPVLQAVRDSTGDDAEVAQARRTPEVQGAIQRFIYRTLKARSQA